MGNAVISAEFALDQQPQHPEQRLLVAGSSRYPVIPVEAGHDVIKGSTVIVCGKLPKKSERRSKSNPLNKPLVVVLQKVENESIVTDLRQTVVAQSMLGVEEGQVYHFPFEQHFPLPSMSESFLWILDEGGKDRHVTQVNYRLAIFLGKKCISPSFVDLNVRMPTLPKAKVPRHQIQRTRFAGALDDEQMEVEVKIWQAQMDLDEQRLYLDLRLNFYQANYDEMEAISSNNGSIQGGSPDKNKKRRRRFSAGRTSNHLTSIPMSGRTHSADSTASSGSFGGGSVASSSSTNANAHWAVTPQVQLIQHYRQRMMERDTVMMQLDASKFVQRIYTPFASTPMHSIVFDNERRGVFHPDLWVPSYRSETVWIEYTLDVILHWKGKEYEGLSLPIQVGRFR